MILERPSRAVGRRVNYYRRVLDAYLWPSRSHLSFWHDTPAVNERAFGGALGEYYQTFLQKADYAGPYDAQGIPRLDYRGAVGEQYNPIAIAQYGLGNFNLYRRLGDPVRRQKFLNAANWLLTHLEPTAEGTFVWKHHFDWEYRDVLKDPWYSALAQGQGLSMLVRAQHETGDSVYTDAANRALQAFFRPLGRGGVTYTDAAGNVWFEEVIVEPPTHILNGFIWASWGVYDYALWSGSDAAKALFNAAVGTLRKHLRSYDSGFWSLYEQSGLRLPMLASVFYHRLHIVQLRVMYRLTGEGMFQETADRWEIYLRRPLNRTRALYRKAIFKLLYY